MIFIAEHVSVESVRRTIPRAKMRLEGFGPQPSVLTEGQPRPCSLRFNVTYLNRLRDGSVGETKPFASLVGKVQRVRNRLFFATESNSGIEHDPVAPPTPDEDPRRSRPLEYELSFATDQCNTLATQRLAVPRAPNDAARFIEIRVELTIDGTKEGTLETSGVWDIPYASLRRRVKVGVFEPSTTKDALLLVKKSDGKTVLGDEGDLGEASRDFDLTELPPEETYEFEITLGSRRLAPPLKLNIKNLELGLLLEDATRAAQSVLTLNNPLPDPLSGSENHNFGNLPFDETPTVDFVEFTIVDGDGKPLAQRPFRVTFADGSTRNGVLDASGHVRLNRVPRGQLQIELADEPDALLTLDTEGTA